MGLCLLLSTQLSLKVETVRV